MSDLLEGGDRGAPALEGVHAARGAQVPQLQAALFARQQHLVQVRAGVKQTGDLERRVAER